MSGSDRIAGSVSLGEPQLDGHAANIGYWVAPWARGRGVATDAARALAGWALQQGFGRIELTTDPANVASQRVAVAAGFTHEGVRRAANRCADAVWRDTVVWSRLATDPGTPMPRALPELPDGRLTDGVITLSPIGEADTEDRYRLSVLPEVVATTVPPRPPTHESIAKRCSEAPYRWLIGERAECVIRDATTGSFVGDIGVFYEGPTGQAMVGYSLVRDWRGRRYATRAVCLMADWAFDVAGLKRLVAGTAPDNVGSQRTLERAGFTREGYERSRLPGVDGTRIDNVAWAQRPDDRPARGHDSG
jgi:RimJ/RimL family protein N-acetyltransferase